MGIIIDGTNAAGNIDLGTNGTITDLAVGGLPDGTVDADTIAAAAKYDDTNLRKDLATLALQTAVDTNRKAYNLNNSFIDQFEDDTGIATETNVDRNTTDECVSSVVDAVVTFTFNGSGTHDKPRMYGAHPDTGVRSQSGGWTNDSIEGGGVDIKTINYADFAYDLAHDFTSRMYYVLENSNTHTDTTYTSSGILIIRNTSATTGKAPTYDGSSIFRGMQVSGSDHTPYTTSPAVLDDYVLTSAYASHINLTSFSAGSTHQTHGGDRDETYDMASDNSNGSYFATRWSGDNQQQCGGSRVTYDESESKIEVDFFNTSGSRHTNSPTLTINNVPNTGRVIVFQGHNDNTSNWHTIYSSSLTMSSGSIGSTTSNATGTLIGSANTASSSRTKVSGTFLYKNASGTATIGTDLKIYFTCNGGTNWTEAASYTAGSDFSTGIKTVYLGETTCTAGTDVRYKAVWANQASGSKVTQLHGVGVNY